MKSHFLRFCFFLFGYINHQSPNNYNTPKSTTTTSWSSSEPPKLLRHKLQLHIILRLQPAFSHIVLYINRFSEPSLIRTIFWCLLFSLYSSKTANLGGKSMPFPLDNKKAHRKQTNKSQSTIAAAGDGRMDISYIRCMFAISNPQNTKKKHKNHKSILYISNDKCDRFSLSFCSLFERDI